MILPNQGVINKRNLDAIDTLVADNIAEQAPLPGQGPGGQGCPRTGSPAPF
jgi:hypothetical protein